LLRTYEQMPEPKFVISVGSCSISGGVFEGCYNVGGSVDEVIPVDVFIPGCPPRPEAIVDGIIQLITHLQEGKLPPSQMKKLVEQVTA
jgi:NADH:ubiquinone oxidoreductase subunit B-like Fe-S oxidoreductase